MCPSTDKYETWRPAFLQKTAAGCIRFVENINKTVNVKMVFKSISIAFLLLPLIAAATVPRIDEIYGTGCRLKNETRRELHYKAESLFAAGQYSLGLGELEKALRVNQSNGTAEEADIANILLTMAEGKLGLGKPDEAELLLEKASHSAKETTGTNTPTYARLCLDRALVLLLRGKSMEAQPAIDHCLAIQTSVYGTNHIAFALCLQMRASALLSRGEAAEAGSSLEHSERIIVQSFGPRCPQNGLNLCLKSLVALRRADFATALRLCQKSVEVLESIVGPSHIARVYANNSLVSILETCGDYTAARSVLQTNLILLERSVGRDNVHVATVLNSMGLVYYAQGDYASAEKAFRESLAIRENKLAADGAGYAATVNNLALILIEQDKVAESSTCFRTAATALDASLGNRSPELATVLCNWGALSESIGQLEIARQLYQEAISIRDKAFGEHHPATAESITHYASLQLRLGATSYALKLAKNGLAIRRDFFGPDHPLIAESLDLLASIYAARGEQVESLAHYSESAAIKLHSLGWGHPALITTLENAALACQAVGDYGMALKTLGTVFPMRRFLITSQFGKAGSADVQQTAQATLRDMSLYHSLLLKSGNDSGLFLAERGAEQLALNKAIIEELEVVRAALEADSSGTTRELRAAYSRVELELANLGLSALTAREKQQKRTELQSQLDSLETRIGKRIALIEARILERQFTLSDIGSALPEKSCLLDFVRLNRFDFAAKTNKWKEARYLVYLTFPSRHDSTIVSVRRVDLGEAAPIDQALDVLRKRMSKGQFAAAEVLSAQKLLSALIYAPLAQQLGGVEHLIICPDGQLNCLPFELLSDKERFLVEGKTISYVTSGREVASLAKAHSSGNRPGRGTQSLILGNPDFDSELNPLPATSTPDLDSALPRLNLLSESYRALHFTPLPETEAEARGVADLIGAGSQLLLGADARKAALRREASPVVLHLATHGFFLPDQEFTWKTPSADSRPSLLGQTKCETGNTWENPLVRCGLALAGANNAHNTNSASEEGLLTGLEASLLNLQGTRAVILSACDTGSGEVRVGEGVMSLRRAFRIAGAETVIASHWKVSDKATSRLMTEFIRRWRSGESRGSAWRNAQLALLHSEEFSSPYFWAAFTLTGQWK